MKEEQIGETGAVWRESSSCDGVVRSCSGDSEPAELRMRMSGSTEDKQQRLW